jgi:cytochrome P450
LLGDETDRDARQVTDAVNVVLKRFALGLLPGASRLLDTNLPGVRVVHRAIAAMTATVERIVRDHRRDPTKTDDMVAALLAASEDGETLSDTQVRDETLTLMLAGFETTANALAWTWWLLDQNPEVAERLRAEVQEVLGDRAATYDDLPRLPYAMAVIAETLRLRPPAWILEREAKESFDLGGYMTSPGLTLLVSPWILQRDPRSWGSDAEVYRPDRWLAADGGFDHNAPGQPKGAYLPFGAGSRICIGESFAWAEAVLVLVTLARRWAPATLPGQSLGMWAAVTLRPNPDIKMRLERAPVSAVAV